MSYTELLKYLGFDSDPFDKTNADEEDRLDRYFIKPPFFDAVYGDIENPKSSVVFAPRGGGKTALKCMIEVYSKDNPFMCITYNKFDAASQRLVDITLDYHLKNIIRLVLVAVITSAENRGVKKLTNSEKYLLYLFIKEYLSEIDQTEIKDAVNAVKNFADKAVEWIDKYTGPIGLLINVLLSSMGFQSTEIEKFRTQTGGKLGGLASQLESLQTMSKKLGYKSTYLLIDRVDETNLTMNNADKSYNFIKPLLTDLYILELPGIGFKLFLWDSIRRYYQKDARSDRIKYYELKWEILQLKDMLSKRLKAYSDNNVYSFMQICDLRKTENIGNIDDIIILFAQGSPRNIIRICKEIIDQQSEIDSKSRKISKAAIIRGFEEFAKNYTRENLSDKIIRELKKTKRTVFTIKYIYNEVFKFTQQAGISKINTWRDKGIVENIGVIEGTKGAKKSNLYGLTNLLVAKHIFSNIDVFKFIESKIHKCKECGEILLRDWDITTENVCHSCQSQNTIKKSKHRGKTKKEPDVKYKHPSLPDYF